MRKLIVALSLVVGINACKTAEMGTGSTLAAGPEGGFCPTFDFTRIKDPIERAKTIRFLMEMWAKGNSRAGMLLGAALYNVSPEAFMRMVNERVQGKLLSGAQEGVTLTEANVVAGEVERLISEGVTAGIAGLPGGIELKNGPIDSFMFLSELAKIAKAEAAAKTSSKSGDAKVEAIEQSKRMVTDYMSFETSLRAEDLAGPKAAPGSEGEKTRNRARNQKFAYMQASLEMADAALKELNVDAQEIERIKTELLLDGMKSAWMEHIREAVRATDPSTYIATAQIWRNEMAAFYKMRNGEVDRAAFEKTGIDEMIRQLRNPAERAKLASAVAREGELERALDFRGAETVAREKVNVTERLGRMRAGK